MVVQRHVSVSARTPATRTRGAAAAETGTVPIAMMILYTAAALCRRGVAHRLAAAGQVSCQCASGHHGQSRRRDVSSLSKPQSIAGNG